MSDAFRTMTANEWKHWTDREDASLRVLTAPGRYDALPLTAPGGAVKRRAITWKEMAASAGAYTSRDRAWILPRVNLPDGVEPKPGDIVRDLSDVDWTVGDVTVGKFGNTFKCVCRALAVVNELSAVGVLTRPDGTRDAAGRQAQASYAAVGEPVRCRVQPLDSQAGDAMERRTIPRQFAAYLACPLAADARDVFTVTSYDSYGGNPTGTVAYTVKGFRNPERLWDLMQLDLELIS
jgi:hypothetical protein